MSDSESYSLLACFICSALPGVTLPIAAMSLLTAAAAVLSATVGISVISYNDDFPFPKRSYAVRALYACSVDAVSTVLLPSALKPLPRM